MKNLLRFALILLLSASLFGCADMKNTAPAQGGAQQSDGTEESRQTDIIDEQQHNAKSDEKTVVSQVEEFGKKLQKVSLLAPKDIVSRSIEENYGDFVTPALLAKWQSDPQNAPGRTVSSPWPDRIDVLSVEKLSDDRYQVEGEIIEMTSQEQASGGIAAKRPVTFEVKKLENRWLIDAATLGASEDADSISFENTQYGFLFTLPKSWEGYTIVTEKWEGLAVEDTQNDKVVESGPIIYIRHPQWTSENPRQDIPVMIFSLAQWNSLQEGNFHIGAAPVGPKELGRNSEFVFALPARYNFAFPTGYEEVENILNGNPLQPLEDDSDV